MNNLFLFIILFSPAIALAGERKPEPPPIPRFIAPAPKLDPSVLARAEAGLARHRKAAWPAAVLPAMPAIPKNLPAAAVLTNAEQEAVDASFAPYAMGGSRLSSLPARPAKEPAAPAAVTSESPSVPERRQPSDPGRHLIDLRGSIVGLELQPLPKNSVLAGVLASQSEEPTLFTRVKLKLLNFQP